MLPLGVPATSPVPLPEFDTNKCALVPRVFRSLVRTLPTPGAYHSASLRSGSSGVFSSVLKHCVNLPAGTDKLFTSAKSLGIAEIKLLAVEIPDCPGALPSRFLAWHH